MPTPYIIGPDPNYRREMSQRWGAALNTLLDMMDRKKKEKEQEMYRDLAILQGDPRAAAGKFGQEFMERYPEKASLAQHFSGIGQQALREDSALDQYIQQRTSEQNADFSRTRANMEFQDNPLQELGPVAPSVLASEMARRAVQEAAVPPADYRAFAGLPPEIQADAARAMTARKMPLPQSPAPEVDPLLRTLMASGVGPMDAVGALRQKYDLDVSPNVQAQLASTEAGRQFRTEADALEHQRRLERSEKDFGESERLIRLRAELAQDGGTGGKAKKDSSGEILEQFDKFAKAQAPTKSGGPKKNALPVPSLEVQAQVAELLGPMSPNGKLLGSKAVAAWQKILTDKKTQDGLSVIGKKDPEEALLWWAQTQAQGTKFKVNFGG